MRPYFIRIEIEEGEIDNILNELYEAQEKISQCYGRLIELGVVKVCKKPPVTKEQVQNKIYSKRKLQCMTEHEKDMWCYAEQTMDFLAKQGLETGDTLKVLQNAIAIEEYRNKYMINKISEQPLRE